MSSRSRRTTNRKEFRLLRREDLLAFDEAATALILYATSMGVLGRISNKGHCILRNSSGGTTAVARNSSLANRTSKNAQAGVRRLLRDHRQPTPDDEPARPAERITVTRALRTHGAGFATWLDSHPDGLAPDALIEVTFTGSEPTFTLVDARKDISA